MAMIVKLKWFTIGCGILINRENQMQLFLEW